MPATLPDRAASPAITVISTLFDEADTTEAVIGALLAQTRPPDEIVITDAGSTDGTREILDRIAADEPRLRVIHQPGDRTVGRNTAIAAASSPFVACIDGSCIAEPDWLEHIAGALDDGADWVAGYYRPEGTTLLSTCIGLVMVYTLDEVDAEAPIPSARSLAFSKEAWERVGGFPHTFVVAEDTAFAEALRAAGYRARFVPEAVVAWRPPKGLVSLWITAYRWGRGDGLSGLRNYELKYLTKLYGLTAVAFGLALWLQPGLAPLALVPLAVNVAINTKPKFRWARGWPKYLLIPIAHLVATAAQVTGFVVGAATAKLRPDENRWRAPTG